MNKQRKSPQRLVALFMAMTMLLTFASPAMAFEPLTDVTNVTDYGPGSNSEETPPPADDDKEEELDDETESSSSAPDVSVPSDASDLEDSSSSSSEDAELPDETEDGPPVQDSGTPLPPAEETDAQDPLTVGTSGLDPPDGIVTFEVATGRAAYTRSSNGSTITMYMEKIAEYSHTYPFSGGSPYSCYKFYTSSGDTAYCIEPARFNSTNGTVVTGSKTYSALSRSQQNEIARAIAANPSGHSNDEYYIATQAIIWEIAYNQSPRSGSVYTSVIQPNAGGLSGPYEKIRSNMEEMGEVPSFMSKDPQAPTEHTMAEDGSGWSIELENTNPDVTMKASDFETKSSMRFSVSGDTLTVTSASEPGSDSYTSWHGGSGDGALIFWNSSQQGKASMDRTAGIPADGYMTFSPEWEPNDQPPDTGEKDKVGYLLIQKYDGKTNLPLGGAVFAIQSEDYVNDNFVVPYGGKTVVIPIPKGKDNVQVTVTEVTPPAGYALDSTPKTVTVTANETVNIAEVGFVNYPLECSLEIYKHEKGDKAVALEGARFQVRYADPDVCAQVWTLTTDASGRIHIDLPSSGTLIIEELEAPAGYVIGQISTHEVVVQKGENKVIDISNDKKAQLLVYKKDAQSGQLLAGAVIKATLLRSHTEPYEQGIVHTVTTGEDGCAVFNDLIPGEWRIEEQSPPQYYLPTEIVHTVSIYDGSNEAVTVTFKNQPWTGLTVRKVDATDGHGLEGAVIKLYEGTAAESTKFLGDYVTNENGIVVIPRLESEKWYTLVEAQAPYNYFIDQEHNTQTILIKPDALDRNLTVVFRNLPKPKLLITKIDQDTNVKLAGAVFRVAEKASAKYVEVETAPDGTVLLEGLNEGWYQVSEIRSPSGYLLDSTVHDVELVAGKTTELVVNNRKEPGLVIRKVDEQTGEGLEGVTLRVVKDGSHEYQDVVTGPGGLASLTGLEPGWMTVTELRTLDTHILDTTPHHIEVKPGEVAELTIKNKAKPALKIIKTDKVTSQTLEGVTFEISIKNGKTLGEFTTNASGEILIEKVEAGQIYVVREKSAPAGYLIDEAEKEILVEWGKTTVVPITNTPENPLIIKKVDAVTGEPIPDTTFLVTKVNGELVGEYKTGSNGMATITGQEPGWFQVKEIKANPSYILSKETKLVQLRKGSPAVVEFENKPLTGLQIRKVDDITGEPLEGVQFYISEISGKTIGTYTTDSAGIINLPEQTEKWVQITEVKGREGYKPDKTPRTIKLESGKLNIVEYRNQPYPVLKIIKLDAETRQPLEGVQIRLYDKYHREIGTYTTNKLGQIILSGVDGGETLYAQEVQALEGYELDKTVHEVTLSWGKTSTLELLNSKRPVLRLLKLDTETQKPVYGVIFNLYDAKGNLLGEFSTDQNGVINIPQKLLSEGRYKLKEIKADGYVVDPRIHTVEVKSGETTEITLENQPIRSQIQITKVSSGYNPITRDKEGARLEGAVFEIVNARNEVVDRITTDSRGIATSKPLPVGKYACREITSPDHYLLDGKVFYAEIKLHEDLIQFEVANKPKDISVTVEKRGNTEVMPGDSFTYDFSNIANTSNADLDDFYFHDLLPTDAVRLNTIYTGTWSEKLTYSVLYRTNKKSSYRVLEDDLSTTVDNEIVCTRSALRLGANEYITDIKFDFGPVPEDFHCVEGPAMTVTVLGDLPDGYRFTNRADVGGEVDGEWTYAKDAWTTCVFAPPRGELPQTGYQN